MKKFTILLILVGFALSSSNVYSQEKAKTKRQIRKEERAAEIEAGKAEILLMLQKRSFRFVATEMYNPNLVKLSDLSVVKVSPTRFICNLPAGGNLGSIESVEGNSMQNYLDIDVKEYEMEVKDAGKRGYNVTILANNLWNKVDYNFRFNVTPDGKLTTLDVSAKISTSVKYSGDFLPNQGMSEEAIERKEARAERIAAEEAAAEAAGEERKKTLIDLF